MAATQCSAKSSVISAVYDKNVHTVATHAQVGVSLPLGVCTSDERSELNPIDMLAMGLASCLLILMGKAAVVEKVDITGSRADVTYTLDAYRITSFAVNVNLSRNLAPAIRTRLEEACKTCPVYLALHPDVRVEVNFNWPA